MTSFVDGVRLYYADRHALSGEVIAALVTPDDRARISAGMHPRRRAEFLASRALLRHALASSAGASSESFRIETDPNGKPTCANGPAISLSHSADFLVCALADSSVVGVDVEARRRGREREAVAERFFTKDEAHWVAGDPEQRFRMLWVLKEAYLKALGVGLAGGLDSLECRIEPPMLVASTAHGKSTPHLALFAGQSDCFVGVATLDAPQPILTSHCFLADTGADTLGPLRLVARTA